MGSLSRHILQQGPVVAALGRSAFMALAQQVEGKGGSGAPQTPGQTYTAVVAAVRRIRRRRIRRVEEALLAPPEKRSRMEAHTYSCCSALQRPQRRKWAKRLIADVFRDP